MQELFALAEYTAMGVAQVIRHDRAPLHFPRWRNIPGGAGGCEVPLVS